MSAQGRMTPADLGHDPYNRSYTRPLELVDWELCIEAITLETVTTTSRPVMNSPVAMPRQETGHMRLHGKRIATPRAEEETGSSSRPEARPVTATARFFTPVPETSHAPLLGELKAQGVSDVAAAGCRQASPGGAGQDACP